MTSARLPSVAGAASAALLLCGFTPAHPTETALSPDGKLLAGVDHPAPDDADAPDRALSVLWVQAARGGPRRILLSHAGPARDPKQKLQRFRAPVWSSDGRKIYVTAEAWPASAAVHEITVATGFERFVVDGEAKGVIRGGRYEGMLLAVRHKYRRPNGQEPYASTDVVRADGRIVLTVPGADDDEGGVKADRWLKANGWSAN